MSNCRPMGPHPAISTVSPAVTRAFCTAFKIVLIGSINVASSKLTLSGRATIPRSATQGMALTYSAKPKPNGGGFAENVRAMPWVAERGIVALPDNVSFEEATFIEPINTILKAVQKARVAAGETVL